jgi:hypothetical protein
MCHVQTRVPHYHEQRRCADRVRRHVAPAPLSDGLVQGAPAGFDRHLPREPDHRRCHRRYVVWIDVDGVGLDYQAIAGRERGIGDTGHAIPERFHLGEQCLPGHLGPFLYVGYSSGLTSPPPRQPSRWSRGHRWGTGGASEAMPS